jgi:predicted flap endonuclease-1-like 5' DNA nuclease
MFDIWLRAFWRTFLWWLPGGDDDGETAFGKREAGRSETARTTGATAESGGSGAGARAQTAGSAQTAAASETAAQAKPESPATSETPAQKTAPATAETPAASGGTGGATPAAAGTAAKTASGSGNGHAPKAETQAQAQAKPKPKTKAKAKGTTTDTSSAETATQSAAPTAAKGESAPAGGAEAGDLTAIKGIGPTLASRLQGLGITSMQDLAHADPDQIAEKLGSRPVTPERVRQWIDDAKTRVT